MMELSNKLNEYAKDGSEIIKRNWKILILILLFTFGMLIGIYFLKQDDFASNIIYKYFNSYMKIKKEQSISASFISSVSVNSVFLFVVFTLGLCAIGTAFIVLIPIIKGIGVGVLCGYLYANYTFAGLGYCVLIIYPGLILSLFALLTACSYSISSSYSLMLSALGSGKRGIEGESELKLYCIRYLIICSIFLASSVIDSVVLKLFSNLFSF